MTDNSMPKFRVTLKMIDGSYRATACYAADEIGALYTVASTLAAPDVERPRVVQAWVESASSGSVETWNVIVPPKLDPRAIEPSLVDRYRKARAAVYATLGPSGDARDRSSAEVELVLRERHESCVDLANAVVAALDESGSKRSRRRGKRRRGRIAARYARRTLRTCGSSARRSGLRRRRRLMRTSSTLPGLDP